MKLSPHFEAYSKGAILLKTADEVRAAHLRCTETFGLLSDPYTNAAVTWEERVHLTSDDTSSVMRLTSEVINVHPSRIQAPQRLADKSTIGSLRWLTRHRIAIKGFRLYLEMLSSFAHENTSYAGWDGEWKAAKRAILKEIEHKRTVFSKAEKSATGASCLSAPAYYGTYLCFQLLLLRWCRS